MLIGACDPIGMAHSHGNIFRAQALMHEEQRQDAARSRARNLRVRKTALQPPQQSPVLGP